MEATARGGRSGREEMTPRKSDLDTSGIMLLCEDQHSRHERSLMASIQRSLFGWQAVESLGELERLGLVLRYLPDEPLMRELERERGQGRDDYPIRAVWNSLLAGIVYQHPTAESLRRELRRNPSLRQTCGFDPLRGAEAVPPPSAYTRFFRSLLRHAAGVERVFAALQGELEAALPDLGATLAVDGKAIPTYARPRAADEPALARDGRRDVDADWGVKERTGKRADGTLYTQVTKWFGYKLHLVVDARYELPVAYEVTAAAGAEAPAAEALRQRLAKERPTLLKERTEYWLADKGYDDGKMIARLWDEHGIKAVIDIRDCWKDGEETRGVRGQSNVVYTYAGEVYCYPGRGERHRMAYGGFEADRASLKYRCPAAQYGFACPNEGKCAVKGAVRIALAEERRVFTPLARSRARWRRVYRQRTAVERVNGRLDTLFGFERHTIRGLAKMRLRVGLALVVMLAMALGRIKEKEPEKMRSLVLAA